MIAIEQTFKRRDTHKLDPVLKAPADTWTDRYASLADECEISTDIAAGFRTTQEFVSKIFS